MLAIGQNSNILLIYVSIASAIDRNKKNRSDVSGRSIILLCMNSHKSSTNFVDFKVNTYYYLARFWTAITGQLLEWKSAQNHYWEASAASMKLVTVTPAMLNVIMTIT